MTKYFPSIWRLLSILSIFAAFSENVNFNAIKIITNYNLFSWLYFKVRIFYFAGTYIQPFIFIISSYSDVKFLVQLIIAVVNQTAQFWSCDQLRKNQTAEELVLVYLVFLGGCLESKICRWREMPKLLLRVRGRRQYLTC